MNKENGVGQLSDEQRARISRNFRAAKALRDRKRHRGTCYASNSFPQKIDVEISSVVGGVNRVPLSDISVNTPTTVKHFKLNDSESVRESHFKASSIGKSDGRLFTRTIPLQDKSVKDHSSFQTPIRQINYSGNSCANEASISRFDLSHNSSIPNQNGCGLDSFRTQVRPFASNISSENSTVAEKQKPKDYSGSASFVTPMGEQSFSSLSEPSTVMPTIFYEDFDDSILAEIDAICESGIKSKVVSQDSSSDIQLKSGHPKPNSCELKTKVGPVVLENLQSDKVLDGSNDSGSTEGMPEDYAKYMKSLNESGLDSFKTPIRPFASNVSSENSTVAEKQGPKDYSGLAPFVTPMGEQSSSSLSEPSTIMPTIFHEDFDDSILAEIDAICESGIKSEAVSQDSSSDIQLKSVHTKPNSCEFKTEVAPVVLEKLQSDKVLDGSSDSGLTEGMPEDYAKYMKSLNDRQREAACSDIAIPLMIVAGPGSGKTSTMVGRVLMLLHKGIEASNILAMTFTTAAASEMRDRIGSVAGKTAAKEVMISTFHSFSLQLCRLHAEKLGRTPEFLLYGQGQQRKAVIEAVRLTETGKNLQISESDKLDNESTVTNNCLENFREKSKKWLKFVTQAKASGKTSEDYEGQGNSTGAAILRKYEDILKSCNALDYHDLISCSVKLLTGFPEVFTECQESWQAIVIDEFQDTSTMQYDLLRCLASHKRITIVGDEDQSIFSFNGADVSGFKSFRRDFQPHKEVRLNKNYRSTRYIVDAASCLIRNNSKRCQLNKVITDNSSGSKIVVKECCNEDAQCSFVVDKILELSSSGSSVKGTFGEIAVLYRRQVSGKMFQTSFRERKIPFNVHGVAFYRKKVVRAIISMLKTTMVVCDDESFRRVFKALLNLEKDEKKRIIDHINKVSTVRKCSFIATASDVFSAKISGTFKRSHLAQGRKVLVTLGLISKLVYREQSISTVIRSVANMIPQKYLLEQRAVVDVDGGKLLNEEHDIRSVLQYLLDDVSEFLKSYNFDVNASDNATKEKGCANVLKEFIDFISERETENFRVRRHDNNHAVTLTTIHQSKGLEWDTVFIVKANESEIPLLHEYNGITKETCSSLEEERRLLYVAMTRARKKLFILHVTVDSNWQVLQPSRFLKEIPKHLLEIQDESSSVYMQPDHQKLSTKQSCLDDDPQASEYETVNIANNGTANNLFDEDSKESIETILPCNGNDFLKRFSSEERATVSHLFHQWAKKAAFKEPKRLLDKVAFVIDERLRVKKTAQKDVLRSLKSCLKSNEAFQYAENVLRWLQIPADKRAYITREKQEHFQKLRIESAMGSSEATSKQIAYLQSLGCTTVPSSRLHASRLIEQYKSL